VTDPAVEGWDCHVHVFDCHVHVFEPGASVRPGHYAPVARPLAEIERLAAAHGIGRLVLVQPSVYGTDNAAMLNAIRSFGAGVRAVAVTEAAVSAKEIETLHAAGVRGLRFNVVDRREDKNVVPAAMLRDVAKRIAPFGWHIELVVQGAKLPSLETTLSGLPCPLVIDHIAHVPQPGGLESDAMRTARRLVERGNTWITLSGPYIDSKSGAPVYADVAPVAKAFIDMAPERLLWGTDWPHPTQKSDKPDDANLVDVIAGWIGQPKWQQIFVSNPEKLYGFV